MNLTVEMLSLLCGIPNCLVDAESFVSRSRCLIGKERDRLSRRSLLPKVVSESEELAETSHQRIQELPCDNKHNELLGKRGNLAWWVRTTAMHYRSTLFREGRNMQRIEMFHQGSRHQYVIERFSKSIPEAQC